MLGRDKLNRLSVAGLFVTAVSLAGWYMYDPDLRQDVRTGIRVLALKEDGAPREPFFSLTDLFYFGRSIVKSGSWRTASEAGDGKVAHQIHLQRPSGIAVDSRRNVVVADRAGFVWRIDPAGKATVIAGTGRTGNTRTDVLATQAHFGSPEGLCIDASDNIYVADHRNHMVVMIDSQGILRRVAGNGLRGYSGDSGRATEARLNQPYDVTVDSQGNLFIADFGNHRIRRVSRSGVISTVVGTGVPGFGDDGLKATEARLHGPYGVLVDSNDSLLIADSLNHLVRRVGADGRITTLAGTGEAGYSGDGGSATDAQLDAPQALFATAGGEVYIGDEHNHCIRIVSTDGSITTLVGSGKPGRNGDGLPASHAELNDPEGICVTQDGSALITESQSSRIRMVDSEGRVHTFAGIAPGGAFSSKLLNNPPLGLGRDKAAWSLRKLN